MTDKEQSSVANQVTVAQTVTKGKSVAELRMDQGRLKLLKTRKGFFKSVSSFEREWKGPLWTFYTYQATAVTIPLLIILFIYGLKSALMSKDFCQYTSEDLATAMHQDELYADNWAVCQTHTTKDSCAGPCAWIDFPGTGRCDIEELKLSKEIVFAGYPLSMWWWTDLWPYYLFSFIMITWMTYYELMGIWGITSQMILTAFIFGLAWYQVKLYSEKKFGFARLVARAGQIFGATVLLAIIRPRWVPVKLFVRAVVTSLGYVAWAFGGIMFVLNVLKPVQLTMDEKGVTGIPRTVVELSLATFFFSVWVPIGARKCGVFILYMTLVAVEFIEGQLSPVQKYDMEMYMRFIINYSLDLYRYAYGRGVLLNLSPMSFGVVVFKDLFYDGLHFGVGYQTHWHGFLMKLEQSRGMKASELHLPLKFRFFAKMVEFNKKFNRIDVLTAITWIYHYDCTAEKQFSRMKSTTDRKHFTDPTSSTNAAMQGIPTGMTHMTTTMTHMTTTMTHMTTTMSKEEGLETEFIDVEKGVPALENGEKNAGSTLLEATGDNSDMLGNKKPTAAGAGKPGGEDTTGEQQDEDVGAVPGEMSQALNKNVCVIEGNMNDEETPEEVVMGSKTSGALKEALPAAGHGGEDGDAVAVSVPLNDEEAVGKRDSVNSVMELDAAMFDKTVSIGKRASTRMGDLLWGPMDIPANYAETTGVLIDGVAAKEYEPLTETMQESAGPVNPFEQMANDVTNMVKKSLSLKSAPKPKKMTKKQLREQKKKEAEAKKRAAAKKKKAGTSTADGEEEEEEGEGWLDGEVAELQASGGDKGSTTYNRTFQFANHRIVAKNVPKLEPLPKKRPGVPPPYPVEPEDIERIRPLMEFVQQEVFNRFQGRMLVRLFTASVVIWVPLIGMLTGDLPLVPGFPRADKSSTSETMELQYLAYTVIFFITDLISYLGISLGIHLNPAIALKPRSLMLGSFRAQMERGGRRKYLAFVVWFAAYFGQLQVRVRLDPYEPNTLRAESGVALLTLEHVGAACEITGYGNPFDK
mmetsp:Transcript_20045/g.50562  ORF Transcript_20045/g.50562 Transcript_20045/m.50562 type:complete len:1031 (+) Transcript_20045:198-3290(+)|eukprot:CAMPEP_0178994982 /NCGR_PEP_ID=MMETSP0795-20121207/7590_1 /TAXON_ID=88552 /ORGANISM="Amoebophrya sp., Strain Ameob2" /LENGTH=1030 /DNA_ID=CAMNT_0020687271 /DNA_START=137 /DNA_END=3229 /DNA_ORIENTATION=-